MIVAFLMLVSCSGGSFMAGGRSSGDEIEWVDATFSCPAGEPFSVVDYEIPTGSVFVAEAEYQSTSDSVIWVNYADESVDGLASVDCYDGLRWRVAYATPANLLVASTASGTCAESADIGTWETVKIPDGSIYSVEVSRDGVTVESSVFRDGSDSVTFSCFAGAEYSVSYYEA